MMEVIYNHGNKETSKLFLSDQEFKDAIDTWAKGGSYWCQRLMRLMPKPSLDCGRPKWAIGHSSVYLPERDIIFVEGVGPMWSGADSPELNFLSRPCIKNPDGTLTDILNGKHYTLLASNCAVASDAYGVTVKPIITENPIPLETSTKLYGGSDKAGLPEQNRPLLGA
jgi:hypothetical protein